jgi:DNA-binding NtrC family response regulator
MAEASPQGRKCYEVSHHYDVPCDQAGEHCPMRHAQSDAAPTACCMHHTPAGLEHVDVELRPIQDRQGQVIAVERLSTLQRLARCAPTAWSASGAFTQALAALQRVAPSNLPVLLLGESGTGKELFARALHEASERARGPFVTVDCSGLTETLFESELFGYEKAPSPAPAARKAWSRPPPAAPVPRRDGRRAAEHAGQAAALIESGTFRRVGSVETLRADFRLVAATHKPLARMVEQGLFRQDLYYRINAFPVHLPALRERAETSRCWSNRSSRAARPTACATGSMPRRCAACSTTAGPATSANCATRSTARACSPTTA